MVVDKSKYGVHEHHCCAIHGCKYGDEDCPVVLGLTQQKYSCEDCDGDYFGGVRTELKDGEYFFYVGKIFLGSITKFNNKFQCHVVVSSPKIPVVNLMFDDLPSAIKEFKSWVYPEDRG